MIARKLRHKPGIRGVLLVASGIAKYNYEDEDEEKNRNKRGFRKTYTTRVAVFAGGRNIPQSRIAGEVRRRIIRIVGDII